MRVAIEIVFVLALIVANGVFAMSEIAVVSARKARLQGLADRGDSRARRALALAEDPGRFLSTVQVGITLIGVLAGAFGGATLAGSLAPALGPLPVIGAYADGIALTLVVVIITYLSLIVGELVPKRIGLSAPERIAATVAGPMARLSALTAPLIRLLEASTAAALRLVRVRPGPEAPVSEGEIAILIEQGTAAGVFHEAERAMVAGVFALGDRRAGDLMTPRPDLVWVRLDAPVAEIRRIVVESERSLFPVCGAGLDDVRGILRAKDLLRLGADGGTDEGIGPLVRPALFVPENAAALRLLEAFQTAGSHLAVVVDEYGGTQGIVTVTDVAEAIVGDLPDAAEPEDPEAIRRPDGSWLVDGMLAVERLPALLGIPPLPADEAGDYRTLGGFATVRLGRIPAAGDRLDWAGWRYEVVDMDGNRVDKVLVRPVSPAAQPDAAPGAPRDPR